MDELRPAGQLSAEELAGRLGELLSEEEMATVAGGHSREHSVVTSEASHAV